MGNVYQARISASRKQLLQDSSHGFILKRNVCGLTWRRERREAGRITQSLYAYSGSPGASLEITGTSTWLSELRCFFPPPAGIWLWLLGLFECGVCSFQLQAHFYPITESLFRSREATLSGLLLSKAKKTEGLSWRVMGFKRLFQYFLGWFDLQCFGKSGESVDKKVQQGRGHLT